MPCRRLRVRVPSVAPYGAVVEMAKTPASQAGDCEFDPRRHHQYVPVVKWYHSSLLSCQIRVRIPSGAPYASLAQLEEQPALNRQALGSNPRRRTICTDGGTGRHAGLRSLWAVRRSMRVRVSLGTPNMHRWWNWNTHRSQTPGLRALRVRLPPCVPYGQVANRQTRRTVNPFPSGVVGSTPTLPTKSIGHSAKPRYARC